MNPDVAAELKDLSATLESIEAVTDLIDRLSRVAANTGVPTLVAAAGEVGDDAHLVVLHDAARRVQALQVHGDVAGGADELGRHSRFLGHLQQGFAIRGADAHVGTRGRFAKERGSTADRVRHGVTVPVLMVAWPAHVTVT